MLNQDQNKREYIAKNRRFKDNSYKVDGNWNCITQIVNHTIKNFIQNKDDIKSEVLLKKGTIYPYNKAVDDINIKRTVKLNTFESIPENSKDSLSI